MPSHADFSALQSNERLLSILSDVVKTCVSCDQDIVRALEAVGTTDGSGSSRDGLTFGSTAQTPLDKAVDDEEPLLSLGSALNGK